jgi:hypothetical protein
MSQHKRGLSNGITFYDRKDSDSYTNTNNLNIIMNNNFHNNNNLNNNFNHTNNNFNNNNAGLSM